MTPTLTTLKQVLLAASLGLYVASLAGVAFYTPFDWNGTSGFGILLFGWLEPLAWPFVGAFVAFGWFANPLLVATWVGILRARKRWPVASGLGAVLLAAAFLLGRHVWMSEAELSSVEPIDRLGNGYWLWLGSAVLGSASALCRFYGNRPT